MHTSPEIKDLAEALSKAQGELTNPPKNREVTVRPREGSPYSFAYATLDSILDIVRPVLAKHGLSLVQVVEQREGGGQQVTTRLLHAGGQWIETSLPITVEGNGNQKFGSALTYGRRYSIIALLALAAEEDDDGNASDGNEARPHERQPQGQQNRQQPPARQPATTHKVTPVAGAGAPAAPPAAAAVNKGPVTAANAAKEDCDAVFYELIGDKGVLHPDYKPLALGIWKASTTHGGRWASLSALRDAVVQINKVMGGKARDLISENTLNMDMDRTKPTPEQATAWMQMLCKMANTGEVPPRQDAADIDNGDPTVV